MIAEQTDGGCSSREATYAHTRGEFYKSLKMLKVPQKLKQEKTFEDEFGAYFPMEVLDPSRSKSALDKP